MARGTIFGMLHVLPQSSFTVLWDEYQLQTALEEQKLSFVMIPLLRGRAHRMTHHVDNYEMKDSMYETSASKIPACLKYECYQSNAELSAHVAEVLPSFTGPQTQRNSSAVDWSRTLKVQVRENCSLASELRWRNTVLFHQVMPVHLKAELCYGKVFLKSFSSFLFVMEIVLDKPGFEIGFSCF